MKSNTVKIVAIQASAESDPSGSFVVHDDASANWVLRKVVEARAYAKHIKTWADGELKRAASEEDFFLRMYGRQLEDWARSQIKSRRRKSLRLPAGTVGFRIAPVSLQVLDEQKLIAWCRSVLPDALKIQTHVLKQQVKEHAASTGKCPDGAEIVSGREKFYVRKERSGMRIPRSSHRKTLNSETGKEFTLSMQKQDVVRVSAPATVRSMPRQRTPSTLSVSARRQTQVESQIYTKALDAVLAEWVRQHLGADGKQP